MTYKLECELPNSVAAHLSSVRAELAAKTSREVKDVEDVEVIRHALCCAYFLANRDRHFNPHGNHG